MSDARVHPAARAFQSTADLYERARPDYADAAIHFLAARLGLAPGRIVLDLGAGTGKLTRQLVATGASIVAVEPLSEMRARLAAAVPEAETLDATAERLPLADGSVDAITVGQAFHWFDANAALAEMHRVLRPGGGLALVWNNRQLDDPLEAAVEEIIEPHAGGVPRRRALAPETVLTGSGLFERVELSSFEHRQELDDEEGLVARVLSISFVASAAPDVRSEIESRLRQLAHELSRPIVIPLKTDVYTAVRAVV